MAPLCKNPPKLRAKKLQKEIFGSEISYHADPAAVAHALRLVDGDENSLLVPMSDCASDPAESPNSKRVREELQCSTEAQSKYDVDLSKLIVKRFDLPLSGGQVKLTEPFQMQVACYRQPQFNNKRLSNPQPQAQGGQKEHAASTQAPPSPKINKDAPSSDVSFSLTSINVAAKAIADPDQAFNLETPAEEETISQDAVAQTCPSQDLESPRSQSAVQEHLERSCSPEIAERSQDPRKDTYLGEVGNLLSENAKGTTLSPRTDALDELCAPPKNQTKSDVPNKDDQVRSHVEAHSPTIIGATRAVADDTLVDVQQPQPELMEHHWPHDEFRRDQTLRTRSSLLNSNSIRISKVSNPVLRARVRVHARNSPAQMLQNPASDQPTEEDMLFILMSRARRRNDRESKLFSENRRLQNQMTHLREDNRICQERLEAAIVHGERQALEIKSFKAEVDDFRSRFTKFKAYAKGLANDHANLGAAFKQFKETQDVVLQDKTEIGYSLGLLKQESAKAVEDLRNMKPELSDLRLEIEPMQLYLRLTEEKLQMSEDFLKHERLRNNRIETQILYNYQIQQRQNLSVTENCKWAASYLDEMCKVVVVVGKNLGKKSKLVDSPGVAQCLELLQALVRKFDFQNATSAEIENMIGTLSKSLLTYHISAEKSAIIVANHVDQIGKDVINRVTASLDSVKGAVATQAEVEALREKATKFETTIEIKQQLFDRVNESRISSEYREKEASKYVGQLIEQLRNVEAGNAQVKEPTATRASPDQNSILLKKWMHQNKELIDEQQKVKAKDDLIRRQEVELARFGDQLKALQLEQTFSQSADQKAQEKIQTIEVKHNLELASIRQEADNALQENEKTQTQIRHLKDQLDAFTEISGEAARVPELVQALKHQIEETNKLQEKADEVPRLTDVLEAKSKEADLLRKKAEKLPELVKNAELQSAEIDQLRGQADEVSSLVHRLEAKSAEIERLQKENAQLSEVSKLLEIAAAQVVKLEKNVPELQMLRAQWLALSLDFEKQNREAAALKTQLEEAKEKASLIDGMRKVVDESAFSIQQLKLKVSDYDQLDHAFGVQKEALSAQSTEAKELKVKLYEAEKLLVNVQSLQEEAERWTGTFNELNDQLELANKKAENFHSLEDSLREKDKELSILRNRLDRVELSTNQVGFVEAENEQNTSQTESANEQISKPQADPQQPTEIQQQNQVETSPQSILDDYQQIQRQNLPAGDGMLPTLPFTISYHSHTVLGTLPLKKADRTTAASNLRRTTAVPSTAYDDTPAISAKTGSRNKAAVQFDETQIVPDSQPRPAVGCCEKMRTPLEDMDVFSSLNQVGSTHLQQRPFVKFPAEGQAKHTNPNPPSSYGGDSMLLEDFEAVEEQTNTPLVGSSISQKERVTQHGSQRGSGHDKASSLALPLMPEDGPGSGRPRRRVSENVDYTTMLEHSSSSANTIPSSPGAISYGKQLANSAAKRRLEPLENEQKMGEGHFKRLKRTPSNLEVRTSTKTPLKSTVQAADPDSGDASLTKMPSGSRKGSVIGANAPPPGRARNSKKQGRKGRKNDRYSSRFSQE